jgi:hypothetical protein
MSSHELYKGKHFNGKKLLRIDALLPLYYKKHLRVQKNYKGNELSNKKTPITFLSTLLKHSTLSHVPIVIKNIVEIISFSFNTTHES